MAAAVPFMLWGPLPPRRSRNVVLGLGLLLAVGTTLCRRPLTFTALFAQALSPLAGGRPAAAGAVRGARLTRASRGGDGVLEAFEVVPASEWLTGRIDSIAPFGAFVEVSLPDGTVGKGLVHISKIRDTFIDNIYDVIEQGQVVKVRVLSVDVGAGKMSLSMRSDGGAAPAAPSDYAAFESVPEDQWLDGTVAGLARFGAFVTVRAPDGEATAQGMVHVSQIRDGFVEEIEQELEEGQEVKVRVVSVDTENGKMSLTMQEPGQEPESFDVTPFEGVPQDQWLDGTVAGLANFGAFVTVTAPDGEAIAQGLVHVTQIKEGFVRSVEDELKEGQEVKVRVLSVDTGNGKMALSMKEEQSEDAEEGEDEEDME